MIEPLDIIHVGEEHAEEFTVDEVVTAKRYFVVVFNRLFEQSESVDYHQMILNARPDFVIYEPHPHLICWVKPGGVVCRQRKGTPVFDVEVDYTSDIEEEKDPTKLPAEIDYNSNSQNRPLTRNIQGRPLRTAAGEPILGLEQEEKYLEISISKNFRRAPEWAYDYWNAINRDVVTIEGRRFPKQTLFVDSIGISKWQTAQVTEKQTIRYKTLSLKMLVNPETWLRRLPNAGYYELVKDRKGTRSVYTRILDASGQPVDRPQFLNKDGERPRVTIDGKRIIKFPLDPEDIVVLKEQTRPEKPFNILPLA